MKRKDKLYKDMETLNRYGYEVMCEHAHSNRYYVVNRKFERSEVQVLLSAVGASQLLSDKKTAMLVQKLLELLGIGEAEQFRDNYQADVISIIMSEFITA